MSGRAPIPNVNRLASARSQDAMSLLLGMFSPREGAGKVESRPTLDDVTDASKEAVDFTKGSEVVAVDQRQIHRLFDQIVVLHDYCPEQEENNNHQITIGRNRTHYFRTVRNFRFCFASCVNAIHTMHSMHLIRCNPLRRVVEFCGCSQTLAPDCRSSIERNDQKAFGFERSFSWRTECQPNAAVNKFGAGYISGENFGRRIVLNYLQFSRFFSGSHFASPRKSTARRAGVSRLAAPSLRSGLKRNRGNSFASSQLSNHLMKLLLLSVAPTTAAVFASTLRSRSNAMRRVIL